MAKTSSHNGPLADPPWRRFRDAAIYGRMPERLVERLDQGSPIVLAGRSSAHGTGGQTLAVQDLSAAAKELTARTGLDFSSLLPSDQELRALLAAAPGVRSLTPKGEPFFNHYVEIDLKAEAGLVLLLSTGTGQKLDANLEQPFIEHLARVALHHNAALVFTKRFDRAGRADWAFAPLALAIEYLQGWLGDSEKGLCDSSDGNSLQWFLSGMSGKNQAKAMPAQTRREQVNRTGTEMIDGRVAYHLSSHVPPGFGVCWLKSVGPGYRHRVLFLDSPSTRPSEAEAGDGLPQVFALATELDGGSAIPVDQVENVRWALARIGKPGWTMKTIAAGLRDRLYSTEMMQRRRGPSATISDDDDTARVCVRAIVDNLDVYETGVLVRGVGAGFDAVHITRCMPASGPWASAEDFARIRRWSQRHALIRESATVLPFSGVACTFDGEPRVLRARPMGPGSEVMYQFRKPEEADCDDAPRQMLLPAASLRDSIIEALCGLDGLPLRLFDGTEDTSPEIVRHRSALSKATADLAEVERRADVLYERILARSDNGEFAATGALAQRLQADFEQCDAEAATLRDTVARLTDELEDMASASQPHPVNDLLKIVESLRDGSERQDRTPWRRTIANLQFSRENFSAKGSTGRRLRWTGSLIFKDISRNATFAIPFVGVYEVGAAANGNARQQCQADVSIADLLNGVPFHAGTSSYGLYIRSQAAERLGIDPSHWLLKCDDPRLIRVTTELLHEPESADPLDPLTARVREYLATPGGRGGAFEKPSRVHAATLQLAADAEGIARAVDIAERLSVSPGVVYTMVGRLVSDGHLISERKRGYRVIPCRCGSTQLTLLDLPLVDGPVCLQCREDRGGLQWPADPYDRYQFGP